MAQAMGTIRLAQRIQRSLLDESATDEGDEGDGDVRHWAVMKQELVS